MTDKEINTLIWRMKSRTIDDEHGSRMDEGCVMAAKAMELMKKELLHWKRLSLAMADM